MGNIERRLKILEQSRRPIIEIANFSSEEAELAYKSVIRAADRWPIEPTSRYFIPDEPIAASQAYHRLIRGLN